jgi:single-strand DNA-binding protein
MSGVNKVILIGRLGSDVEYKQTQSGSPIAKLSLATSDKWKDKQGQPQERTEWHRVILWNKLADIANQYLVKGSQVYLEGKLQTKEYQDQQGQTKKITQVVLNGFDGVMQMLDSKSQPAAAQPATVPPPIVTPPEPQPAVAVVGEEPEDDIPF